MPGCLKEYPHSLKITVNSMLNVIASVINSNTYDRIMFLGVVYILYSKSVFFCNKNIAYLFPSHNRTPFLLKSCARLTDSVCHFMTLVLSLLSVMQRLC